MKKLTIIITVILFGCNIDKEESLERQEEKTSKYFKVLEENHHLPDMYLITLDDSTQYYLIQSYNAQSLQLIKKEKANNK